MSYENIPKAQQEHSETNKLIKRIEKVAARGVKTLTDWERGFLSSASQRKEVGPPYGKAVRHL